MIFTDFYELTLWWSHFGWMRMDGNGEKVETTNQLQWTMNVVDETVASESTSRFSFRAGWGEYLDLSQRMWLTYTYMQSANEYKRVNCWPRELVATPLIYCTQIPSDWEIHVIRIYQHEVFLDKYPTSMHEVYPLTKKIYIISLDIICHMCINWNYTRNICIVCRAYHIVYPLYTYWIRITFRIDPWLLGLHLPPPLRASLQHGHRISAAWEGPASHRAMTRSLG